jgi:hypothetical protein
MGESISWAMTSHAETEFLRRNRSLSWCRRDHGGLNLSGVAKSRQEPIDIRDHHLDERPDTPSAARIITAIDRPYNHNPTWIRWAGRRFELPLKLRFFISNYFATSPPEVAMQTCPGRGTSENL